MRAISTFNLRADLSRYLDEVVTTEVPLVVRRFGKPIVVIEPFFKDTVRPATSYFGFMGRGETGEAFVTRVRRSAREKRAIARFRNRS